MDRPKFSSKLAAAWALQLKMQIHYLQRLHRSEAVRQETEERVGYFAGTRRKIEKSTEECLPSSTHCETSIVEGAPIVGAVVKWFGGFARGGRRLEPYDGSGRKHK